MTQNEVIELIKKYLSSLKQNGINITEAYLYGSYARNTATEDSDIDLMLVSPLFDDDPIKYSAAIWFTASEVSYKIEPVTIGEKRFMTDDYSPLIGIVKKEGIRIAA